MQSVGIIICWLTMSILLLFSYLFDKKFRLDIATISMIVLEVSFVQVVKYFSIPQQWTFLLYLAFFVYCIIEFGFNFRKIVINGLLCIIIVAVLQYILMLLYAEINNVNMINENGALVINIILFCVVLLLRFCKLERVSFYLLNKIKILNIAILFCIVIVAVCLFNSKKANNVDPGTTAIILISAVLICILATYLGKYRIKTIEAETELKVHKLYEESYKTLISNIRLKQHEFDNHINAIYSQQLVCKSYDELVAAQKQYCSEIENDNYFNKLLSAGNSVIVGFLYGKFLEIKKQDIDIQYKVNIKNLECRVPVHKMIELLGNLINNAVDYLNNSNEYKSLFVSILELDGCIRIEVRNACEYVGINDIQQFFTKGYSKKGTNRGLGLYNVKTICDEYKLELSCENEMLNDGNWLSFKIKI